MMEKTDACESHGNAVFVAGGDDMVVAHGTTGLGNKLDTTLVGTLNIVAEGEEGIAAQGNTTKL